MKDRSLLNVAVAAVAVMLAPTAYAQSMPPLVYHNGPVLSAAKVAVLFWGPFTTAERNTATTYIRGLVGYMSNNVSPSGNEPTLRQYGVLSATYAGSASDSSTPSNGAAQLQAEISNMQNPLRSPHLPAYDPQTLILVVAKGTGSCGGFHSSFGPNQFYGFVPFEACSGFTPEVWFEGLGSHEIFEGTTDPDGSGWVSDTAACGQNCEISDYCSSGATVTFSNGYGGLVAGQFDNATSSCVVFGPQEVTPLHWRGWTQIPGATRRALAATSFNGFVYLFTAGNDTDDNIYVNYAQPGQPFVGWNTVGGTTDVPLAATAFDQHLYLFAKGGQDHKIYYNAAAAGQSFAGWNSTPGATAQAMAVTTFNGNLFLVARGDGADQSFYYNAKQPGLPFAGWAALGGGSPMAAAVTSFAGYIYLFAEGNDPTFLYYNISSNGTSFAGWNTFAMSDSTPANVLAPGVTNNGTVATVGSGNRLFLLARGSNNHVYLSSAAPGQAFAPWREIPGELPGQVPMTTDAAPAMTVANGLLYVAVKTPSNTIYYTSADGLWSP